MNEETIYAKIEYKISAPCDFVFFLEGYKDGKWQREKVCTLSCPACWPYLSKVTDDVMSDVRAVLQKKLDDRLSFLYSKKLIYRKIESTRFFSKSEIKSILRDYNIKDLPESFIRYLIFGERKSFDDIETGIDKVEEILIHNIEDITYTNHPWGINPNGYSYTDKEYVWLYRLISDGCQCLFPDDGKIALFFKINYINIIKELVYCKSDTLYWASTYSKIFFPLGWLLASTAHYYSEKYRIITKRKHIKKSFDRYIRKINNTYDNQQRLLLFADFFIEYLELLSKNNIKNGQKSNISAN